MRLRRGNVSLERTAEDFHYIPVFVPMLRSYTTVAACIICKAVVVRALLAWGCSKSTSPLGIMIAISLIFFGSTAEIASGHLDGRSHWVVFFRSEKFVDAGGRPALEDEGVAAAGIGCSVYG
jgi:hypothetical protein